MQLIGMLDSPYVRRVAISLQLLGLPFEHRSISVFRGMAQFREINPVIKAPSLVCDDGTVLMDSSLILQYAEAQPARRRSLMPAGAAELRQSLHVIGLALAACEKSVQVVYEHHVRPPEKLHAPWLERVTDQMQTACRALELLLAQAPWPVDSAGIDQAGLTSAVVWQFIQRTMPQRVPASEFPALGAHSARAEALPEFIAAPHGETTYRPA